MHTAQAEVGVYTESKMPSALGWRRSASEWHTSPPTLATMGGLGLLRQGFSLQAVIHAMIVESQRLSESANVVEAIEESKFKP